MIRALTLSLVTALSMGCIGGERMASPAPELGAPPLFPAADEGERTVDADPRTPDLGEAPSFPTPPGAVAGCEHVAVEPIACVVLDDEGLAMVGLTTGQVCAGPDVDALAVDDGSLGWLDDGVYVCAPGEAGPVVTRVSLEDGRAERSAMPCDAVTDHFGGLLGLPGTGERLDWWPGFDSVMDGQVPYSYAVAHTETLLASAGRAAIFASPGSAAVRVARVDRDETLSVELEGFDGEIAAIDGDDDGRLFVFTGGERPAVHVFDAYTGWSLRTVLLPGLRGDIRGASCRAR